MKAWIFDCNPNNRGKHLESVVKEIGIEAEFHPQVWNEELHSGKPVWEDCEDDFQINNGDVIFVHAQDVQQFYWKQLVKKYKGKSWIVIYSGGGLIRKSFSQEFNEKYKICIFEGSVRSDAKADWAVRDFLECIQSSGLNCYSKLLGHDVHLELKLELLHLCLTPAGREEAKSLFKNELDIRPTVTKKTYENIEYQRATDVNMLRNAFFSMVRVMEQEEDCFSQTYLSALETFTRAMFNQEMI